MWSLLVKQRSNVLKKPVKVRWAFRSTFLCTTHYLESITSPFKKKRLGTDMNNQCLLIYFLISEREKQTCVCFSVCALLAVVEGSLCSAWGVRRMLTNTHTHGRELLQSRFMNDLPQSPHKDDLWDRSPGLQGHVPCEGVIDDSATG